MKDKGKGMRVECREKRVSKVIALYGVIQKRVPKSRFTLLTFANEEVVAYLRAVISNLHPRTRVGFDESGEKW